MNLVKYTQVGSTVQLGELTEEEYNALPVPTTTTEAIAAVTIPTASRIFYLGARFTEPTANEDNSWTNLKAKILAITPTVSTTYPVWVIRDSASDGTLASLGTDTPASLAALGIYAYTQKDWIDLISKSSGIYCIDAGTANAISITLPFTVGAWTDLIGSKIAVKVAATNTGATTIAVTGLTGTKSIKKQVSVALAANDLLAGGIYEFITADGTTFQLVSGLKGDKGDAGTSISESNRVKLTRAIAGQAQDSLNISNIDLSGLSILTADFSNAVATNVKFDSSDLTGASFNSTYLENSTFKNSVLTNADLENANCLGVDFYAAIMPSNANTKILFKALVGVYDPVTTIWVDGEPIGA
jgi:hypothetical protein